METASLQFVFFGLATAVLLNCSLGRVWRSTVLFTATLGFLALLDPNVLDYLPLVGFLAIGYIAMVMVSRVWMSTVRWGVLAVLLVYIWLKKYTFLPDGVLLHSPFLTLGLSYILFRVIHLIVQVKHARDARLPSPGAYLLYVLNFTTFLSGPIQNYDEFARDQFAADPLPLSPGIVASQLERIVLGFFKVNALSLLLSKVQEHALIQVSQPRDFKAALVASIILCAVYPLELYANFSGYIDIVIGMARLMRISLPENFDRPFSASSFIDFWNRWHITLSMWLKNYVYNPLLVQLMRLFPSARMQAVLGVSCYFITFFLVGVWHGRTSEFIAFGLLQGTGVALNKLWQILLSNAIGKKQYKALTRNIIYYSIGRGLTYAWLAFSLFWFWADWKQIKDFAAAQSMSGWLATWAALILIAALLLTMWEKLREALLLMRAGDEPLFVSRKMKIVYVSLLSLAAYYVMAKYSTGSVALVYKAF